jgi:hypothetical protein
MGVSLNICYLCGVIGYDENFNNDNDENFYCKNELKCCLRMCNSTEEYVENCKLVFKNYINIRYISRRLYIDNDEGEFFKCIYWVCENIDKNKSEIFKEKIGYINSYNY